MAYRTTITVVDATRSTISATTVIGVSTHRSQTVGYVNAIGNLTAPRPAGFGKIEWTANGQPTNAAPYDTVIRIDEVV